MRITQRMQPFMRDGLEAVEDTEQAAHGGRLVVRIKTQAAGHVECALEIARAIKQGENAAGAVEQRVHRWPGMTVVFECSCAEFPGSLPGVSIVVGKGHFPPSRLPIVRVLAMQLFHMLDDLREPAARRQRPCADVDQAQKVFFEKSGCVHGRVVHGRFDTKIVVGDPGGPGRFIDGIFDHARGRHCPDFVHQLRVNLKPLRIVGPMPREWRPEARAHQVQGRAIGHPDLVPDVVCPGVGQLLIRRLGAVALHLQEVHVLDVGVVVGKRAVDIAHPV